MDIKKMIKYWQGRYSNEFCLTQKEVDDSAAELGSVLFAIDNLTDKALGIEKVGE